MAQKSISTKGKILSRLHNLLPGSVVFAQDLLSEGSPEAVRQQLSRLAKEGLIKRLTQGIYVIPKKIGSYGSLLPNPEDIATAIARRDKARIIPTGEVALWKLGLSTQMPLKFVYLTDGPSRVIKIQTGKGTNSYTIKFKTASPKNFALRGKISSQLIPALKTLGEKNLDKPILEKIQTMVMRENPDDLNHDLAIAPAWISKLIRQSFNIYKHEGLDPKKRNRKT